MDFFEDSVKTDLARDARLALLHLLRNHDPNHAEPAALLEVATAYLRLNPHDSEVREALGWVARVDRRVGA